MYFRFECPHCSKSLRVRVESAGHKARCPHCHKSLTVPPPASPPAGSEDAHTDTGGGDGMLHLDPSSIPVARAKRSGRTPPPPRPTPAAEAAEGDATNASMLASAVLGALAAGLFLLILLPFKDTYFGAKFFARGWVPYVLTFLFCWGGAILVLKSLKLRRQRSSMLIDLLPVELGREIDENNVDVFIEHVHRMPADPAHSFLVNRVLRGLEHYRVRRSAGEVASMLSSQSDIDANAVDSSYTIPKVFIWAIPILGFIGTVIGIGDAVAGFDATINAADVTTEQLTESLSGITQGLATAFDTTLVALVMSVLVMFPTSSTQKAEEDLLNWVDEYCNENLLKRLADQGPRARPLGEVSEHVRAAINDALAGNYGAMLRDIDTVQQAMARLTAEKVERFDKAVDDLAGRAEQTQHEVANAMLQTAEEMRRYFGKLEQGLGSLNSVLRQLGEKQVVIRAESPPRRGWWPFGRGDRNGGDQSEQ